MIFYLQLYKPLESRLAQNIELMNECTAIFLTYGLLCFTDFVPSEKIRSDIGYYYIGVSSANIFVHLIVLVVETLHRVKLVCKKHHCCNKNSKIDQVKKAPLPKEQKDSKQKIDQENSLDYSQNIKKIQTP
jgi:hypothetical protein